MSTELVTPHDLEAERAVLGAILVDGDLFLEIGDRIAPADFFRDAHQRIFAAILELATQHQPFDGITVKDRLSARGELDTVGGPAYLFGLTDGMPRHMNVGAYAAIVMEKARRRRLQAAVRKIAVEAHDLTRDTRDVLDDAERLIFEVAQDRTAGDFIDADALVTNGIRQIDQLLERKQGVTGIPTGFTEVDAMTRGLQPGTLTLVAARPSMGKSAFALALAYHAAALGHHVAFFSLEMSEAELFMRLVAAEGRIDGHRLQGGYVNQAAYGRLSEVIGAIGASALHVDDSGVLGVLDISGKVRRLKARCGLGLIIIDYLQLMQVGRAENRNLAIADISRSLKNMAKELKVPVVALSQLSREAERRDGKGPKLSDLRDSGALEQDADLVVFIHRAEMHESTPQNKGIAEIIIAKQRNGPTGTVKLRWSKESTRFDNLETHRA